MKQFFAYTASGAYTTTATDISKVNLLTNGQYAFYDANGALITAGSVGVSDYFSIIGKTKDGKIMNSQPIYKKSLKGVRKNYVVAQTKEVAVGYDNATTGSLNLPVLEAGMEATIIVTDSSEQLNNRYRNRYDYSIVITDTDDAVTIATKLADKINADATSPVTATATDDGAGATGVVMTAKTPGKSFGAMGSGILANADKLECKLINGVYTPTYTVLQAQEIGVGTVPQLLESESIYFNGIGGKHTERPIQGMFTMPTMVDTTLTYDVVTIMSQDLQPASFSQPMPTNRGVIEVACRTGNAATTTIMTILTNMMAL
jgi:hypothetical protein